MKKGTQLTRTDKAKVMVEIALGMPYANIAERFDLHPKTVARWANEPAFKRQFKQASQELAENGFAVLCDGAVEAAYQLRAIISDPATPSAIKIRAINTLFIHVGVVSQENNLIKAFQTLDNAGILPSDLVDKITAKLDGVAGEITSYLSDGAQTKPDADEAIELMKAAILGKH